jgi:hypothetical protein
VIFTAQLPIKHSNLKAAECQSAQHVERGVTLRGPTIAKKNGWVPERKGQPFDANNIVDCWPGKIPKINCWVSEAFGFKDALYEFFQEAKPVDVPIRAGAFLEQFRAIRPGPNATEVKITGAQRSIDCFGTRECAAHNEFTE